MFAFRFIKPSNTLSTFTVNDFVGQVTLDGEETMFSHTSEVLTKPNFVFEPSNDSDIAEAPSVNNFESVRQVIIGCPKVKVAVLISEVGNGKFANISSFHQWIMSVCATLDFTTANFPIGWISVNSFIFHEVHLLTKTSLRR